MKNLSFYHQKNLIDSHLILKQIQINPHSNIKVKNIFSKLSFFQISSFQDEKAVEAFFILRILLGQKPWLSYVKKRFKDYHLQFSVNTRNRDLSYPIMAWSLFAFHFFNKKNESVEYKEVNAQEFIFSKALYAGYPLLPNIYFSWIKKLSFQVSLQSQALFSKKCFLAYFLPQPQRKKNKQR